MADIDSAPGFTSGEGGFTVTFSNGWTISVQFGDGTYSANRNLPPFAKQPKSGTAEVAAWDANGYWLMDHGSEVKGWQSPADVLALMNFVAALPAPANATGA